MTDIHYLGEFQTFNAVWKKFPNGGGYGDYVTILGVRYDWDESKNSWGDDPGDVNPALPEVVNHDIDVQGTVTARDGVKTADYIPGTAGAFIDGAGDAEFRSVNVDALRVKDPVTGELLSLPDFIKMYKTELPPDWDEYEQIAQFDNVRILAFDPLTQEKFYTTIGALKKLISDSIGAGSTGGGTFEIEVLRSDAPEGIPTDNNVFSSLRTLLAIQAATNTLLGKYLSRIEDDTAEGFIKFMKGLITASLEVGGESLFRGLARSLEGIQFGESFIPGLTGLGGFIDKDGKAELQSLILRTFLEVPELRFNRIDVIAGDLWNTKGAGIIEEVDTVNQIITLKLEKGEIGRFRYDDIVMGIFHSFNDADNSVDDYDDGLGNRRYSGFGTSYFRVTQILDADRYSKFRYELRPISPRHPKQFHPQPFMTSAAYGNFTNAERQTSMYQTTSYIRLLRNVNNWEFGIENIGMQWGDLTNLSIFGLDMTGYSAYMENVYFSGIIHQLSAKIKEQLDAQRVGGKNLLREYDIRFGFKYWGNAGEYTEFDINQIESTPQLQVQPNILNWAFPIRYGTVVVTANGVWSITTPSWLNAYPVTGSGNKNVDLKAGEYKGRNARTGTAAVQSGVIQRNVSISQAGLTEFVTIDPILNVGYEAQTVTITGKSNSSKLTFTTDTGYLEINLPAQYKVNGANVNNGSLIAGDPGALDEYSFSITVAVGENVEDFSIQNNIFATAEGGQKAISTIVQRRTRVKVLGDTDNSIISIGDMIFHIN